MTNEPTAAPKRYAMKKGINLWAFPYPARMNLRQCMQVAREAGFDGIELNYDLDNELSPKAGPRELLAIRRAAEELGIAITGICSGIWADVPISSNDPAVRERCLRLYERMIQAAHELGTRNLLTVPALFDLPQYKEHDPIAPAVCNQRARESIQRLLPLAEKLGVSLNIENIFFSGYLMTPEQLNAFVDSFQSEQVGVHFDTGNAMIFTFPEQWIPVLGKRIRNVHVKEFNKNGGDYKTLDAFRPLLDGSTNWPAVLGAFDDVGYRGYLTFEYFNPYRHHPEALIHHTSDALDRMLKKG